MAGRPTAASATTPRDRGNAEPGTRAPLARGPRQPALDRQLDVAHRDRTQRDLVAAGEIGEDVLAVDERPAGTAPVEQACAFGVQHDDRVQPRETAIVDADVSREPRPMCVIFSPSAISRGPSSSANERYRPAGASDGVIACRRVRWSRNESAGDMSVNLRPIPQPSAGANEEPEKFVYAKLMGPTRSSGQPRSKTTRVAPLRHT